MSTQFFTEKKPTLLMLYYKAIVIKIVWYWKKTHRSEKIEYIIQLHANAIIAIWFLIEKQKIYIQEKIAPSTNSTGKTMYIHIGEYN